MTGTATGTGTETAVTGAVTGGEFRTACVETHTARPCCSNAPGRDNHRRSPRAEHGDTRPVDEESVWLRL
jgi:hypothetical protein